MLRNKVMNAIVKPDKKCVSSLEVELHSNFEVVIIVTEVN